MGAGLAGRAGVVVGDGVVVVDAVAGRGAGGEREAVAAGLGPDVVLDHLGVLVGVDAATQPQVEDWGDGDVGVAEDLVELAYVDGADALDACDAGAGAERLVGEVDEETSAAAEPARRRAGIAASLSTVSARWSGAQAGCSGVVVRVSVFRSWLVLGVVEEELEQVGGAGEPAHRDGAESSRLWSWPMVVARMSATRSTMASIQAASPAVTRAMRWR